MNGTEPTDISAILTSLGVDEKIATSLENRMNGRDYLDLVNAITTDSPRAVADANRILTKYKIKINRVTEMTDHRLEAAFYEMHTGKKWIDESDLEYVRPIAEMENPVAKFSGYSNFVRAANDDDAQAIMDWLEENEFDYENNDSHTFLVQCSDRDNTYRLNHFVGGRNGKTQMMDNLSESDQTLVANLKKAPFKGQFGEIIASEFGPLKVFGAEPTKSRSGVPDWNIIATDKDGNIHKVQCDTANAGLHGGSKHEFDADKEIGEAVMEKRPGKNTTVPASSEFSRNPVAQAGRMRAGAGAHASREEKNAKRDAWARGAKHKKSFMGERAYTQGETVQYGDHEAPVHIPAGPNGTVGLLIDGKVKMVREDEITRVDEGVMGMTKINPINRLATLAGIRAPSNVAEDENDFNPGMDDFDVADDVDDPMDIDNDAMDMDSDPITSMDGDSAFDSEPNDFMSDDPMDADIGGDDMFGDAGSSDGFGNAGAVDSDAYSMIQDHLNEIQDSLGDVKLSEYRSLIAKLDALTMQIKSMGRDYLGETRRKK